jgi:hypothetical protein
MTTLLRIAKQLVTGLAVVAVTVAAFALVNSGGRSEVDAALIVFGLGTTIIVVGLLARFVSAREVNVRESPLTSELIRLDRLHHNGSLSDEEFAEAKRQLLRGR